MDDKLIREVHAGYELQSWNQPQFSIDTPYLADYFGVWHVHDSTFASLVDRVQGMNLQLHLQSDQVMQAVASSRTDYQITNDGIAQINIRGMMMKAVPSMAEGVSTIRVRQQLKSAASNKQVRGVMLVMDTPGGTVKGNEDLAREVRLFAEKKPIFAFVEDMTASAGVAIASQASRAYANIPTAVYGSIGTYAVLQDLSGMAEQLGVKVYVIKAGEFKGMGEAGTQITEEQLAEVQRLVNRFNENYVALIAAGLGRSVASLAPLADGRVIFAEDAVSQGLLDGVETYQETYAELLSFIESTSARTQPSGRNEMSENPATLQDLKQRFPNSTAEWRESQLEAEASITDAAISYANHVEEQATKEREEHQKELEEAKNAASKADTSSALGHSALTLENVSGDDVQETGDPIADFDQAVRAMLPKHRTPSFQERQAAIASVAREKPELHVAYIRATNSGNARTKRLIAEKYEQIEA